MFENFLASHSQEVPKEADSMVAEGDVITVDYTGKLTGYPLRTSPKTFVFKWENLFLSLPSIYLE